jgi:hypothetical protein
VLTGQELSCLSCTSSSVLVIFQLGCQVHVQASLDPNPIYTSHTVGMTGVCSHTHPSNCLPGRDSKFSLSDLSPLPPQKVGLQA